MSSEKNRVPLQLLTLDHLWYETIHIFIISQYPPTHSVILLLSQSIYTIKTFNSNEINIKYSSQLEQQFNGELLWFCRLVSYGLNVSVKKKFSLATLKHLITNNVHIIPIEQQQKTTLFYLNGNFFVRVSLTFFWSIFISLIKNFLALFHSTNIFRLWRTFIVPIAINHLSHKTINIILLEVECVEKNAFRSFYCWFLKVDARN